MDQTSRCRLLTHSSGGARPAFSPHYSYFTASANGHQRAASFCHTPSLRLIALRCVCVRARVCHCNVCDSSPGWASHKQMGSWKATSHIVTEEIPFFCPQSWWHWWPRHTAQTRPEGGHHPSFPTHKRAQQHLPVFTLFSLFPFHLKDQFTQIAKGKNVFLTYP